MADTEATDRPIEAQNGESQNFPGTNAKTMSQVNEKDHQASQNEAVDMQEGDKNQSQEGTDKKNTTTETMPDSGIDNKDTRRGDNRPGDRRAFNKGSSFKKGKSGNKFDPSSAKESDDPTEIRKQVEFYFSDSNLPNDKFLFEATGGSMNNPVPIKTIHSFKRMRRFQPFSAVVDALKESSTLDVVEDDTAIKRKVALPEGTGSTQPEIQKVFEDKIMSRSVYVKGFGREEPSTQFDIEAWFSKYGDTNQVRLRRADDSTFKGSVFVEFDSEDTAKKFLSLDPAPKYNGRDLMIKSKKQYCDEKVDEINSGSVRRREPDERDWKARRENDRKNGFPALHKDGRDRRVDRRGGGRGGRGGGRDRRDRDNRGQRRREDSEDEDDGKGSIEDGPRKEQVPAPTSEVKDEKLSDTKKREREDDKDSNAPATKRGAIESDMTGEPEAVDKKSDD